MEKKISVVLEELKEQLKKSIIDSKLPIVVIDLIIKDLYTEIHTLAQETTVKDMNEYLNSFKEETEEKNNGNSDNI